MNDSERDASRAALARYEVRMLRSRGIYLSVIGAVVIALAVTVGIAWEHGEIAHTHLDTVSQVPATLPTGTPAGTLSRVWSTTDRAAVGSPRWNGTIVTYSRHTVGGRNAATGRRTWSYTRTDRTVCTAAQTGGVTVAFYELHGNCDEVTGLASDTGERLWTRTLDENGQPLNGHPVVQVTEFTIMITSSTVIYAIDPGNDTPNDQGGIDRWTYSRQGCRIRGAVLGSNGALIAQTCRHTPCTKVKFCAQGPQLLLRDPTMGLGQSSDTNADQIDWLDRESTDLPVSADDLVSAIAPGTSRLQIFNAQSGALSRTLALDPQPAAAPDTDVTATSDTEVVTLGANTYAVAGDGTQVRWHARFPGAPVVTPRGDNGTDAPLASTEVTTVGDNTVDLLDGATGTVERRLRTPGATAGRAYPLGTGMLVTSRAGTAAYR